MSSLTPCNHCTLQRITRDAEARGATVTVERQLWGTEMEGWYQVLVSDRDKPVCWFMELTVECSAANRTGRKR